MDGSGTQNSNRNYYDAFSEGYERLRGTNCPGGYHELLDSLESELVQRYGTGARVLEVGCGTGLVLERINRFAKSAEGVDLSLGMLERARSRGLSVSEASATSLPFEDGVFDVTCSFKVLPHIPEIELALSEMCRVTRSGGHIIAEFYNPHSFRGLIKRFGPSLRVSTNANESSVFTRFDSPSDAAAQAPKGTRLIDSRGIRILTPLGSLLALPVLGPLMQKAERAAADGPLKAFSGFWVGVFRKD